MKLRCLMYRAKFKVLARNLKALLFFDMALFYLFCMLLIAWMASVKIRFAYLFIVFDFHFGV